ncbi:minichromosome maintenance protein MCM [Candidatus Woesearchaeota archaeon]|nr:minichromosome maintenance protein MCM [Candidatus Woesearchaeota archaeon]
MDATQQINIFRDFLETHYKAELLEKIRKGQHSLEIDFSLLAKHNPELADLLLEQPEDVIKAAELAVRQIESNALDLVIRIQNLPETERLFIRDIRSKHLDKLFLLRGIVRQKSDVRPQATAAKFECPSCGNIINVLQLDTKFKEPNTCGCGRKGKFRLLTKELIDVQGIVLEEAPEDLEGGAQAKRINIFLKKDLVSPMSEKRTNPGAKIEVVGQIKEVPIILKSGSQSTRFDLLIEANHVRPIEEEFGDLPISEEEMKQIKEISKDKEYMQKLVESVAPSTYGYEKVKEALLLQLVGGVRKTRDDGTVTRGDTHILLIGDPGAGKSTLLKRINAIAPKSRFVSGKGVSGAGLTATVVKDEFLSGWSLEAGALVLAHRGIVMIDELDKMSSEDRDAMHEALEGQTVTISKANIQATLRCETTVLAAANPKFGRFDPYDIVANQIDLPSTLINRFDLIFPIKDLPDQEKDAELAGFLLKLHKDSKTKKGIIETKLLRKYLAYAKKSVFPTLTDGAMEMLKGYYLKMRSSGSQAAGVKSIPISPRQLEGLIRLSEANARLRLSEKVMMEDAQRAIDLLEYCLRQVAMDEETGTIDIDRISSSMSSSQRNKVHIVKDIINEIEKELGKTIPVEEIMKLTQEKGLKDEETEEVLTKLKRAGDLFEPRRGFVQKI